MKNCNRCGNDLLATTEFFFKSKLGKYGLRGKCKQCLYEIKLLTELSSYKPKKKPIPKAGMKFCSRCNNELPATPEFFHRQSSRSTGLREICKECRRNNVDEPGEVKRARRRKYIQEFPEKEKGNRKRQYYANRDIILARHKIWIAKNAESVSKQHGEYCRTHRLEISVAEKIYRENNPDKFKILRQRRRNKEREVITTLTEQVWRECKQFFNGECAYCGKKTDNPTQEHVIALSKDGPYTGGNIIPACGSCNSSKYNHGSYTWYSKQPFFTKKRFKRITKWIGYDPSKVQQYSMF